MGSPVKFGHKLCCNNCNPIIIVVGLLITAIEGRTWSRERSKRAPDSAYGVMEGFLENDIQAEFFRISEANK